MRMIDHFGSARVVTLDSELFLVEPNRAMARLAAHFTLDLNIDKISTIINGPAFTLHSKFNGRFDGETRKAEQKNAANIHSEEITKVSAWATVIAQNNDITMRLPMSLLST